MSAGADAHSRLTRWRVAAVPCDLMCACYRSERVGGPLGVLPRSRSYTCASAGSDLGSCPSRTYGACERNRSFGSTGVLTPYTQRVNIPQRVNAPPGKSTPLSVSTRLQACQHAEACQRASRRVSTRLGVSTHLQASQHAFACQLAARHVNTPRRVNAPGGVSTRERVDTPPGVSTRRGVLTCPRRVKRRDGSS